MSDGQVGRLIRELARLRLELSSLEIAEAILLAVRLGGGVASRLEPLERHGGAVSGPTGSLAEPAVRSLEGAEPTKESGADLGKPTTEHRVAVSTPSPGSSHGGQPMRVPRAPALSSRQALSRALRPLKRRHPAAGRSTLDEDATIKAIAEEGIWRVVEKPAEERWLTAAIIVDRGPSMALWADAAEEFIRTLSLSGVFRDIELYTLDASATPTLRPGRSTAMPRRARELLDPRGRRLFLVLSDCVGAAWYGGGVAHLLAPLAGAGVLSIVQLLPPSLWPRTALAGGAERWMRSAPDGPGRPLTGVPDNEWDVDKTIAPVPVLQIEPRWLSNWAMLVAGSGHVAARAIGLPRYGSAEPTPSSGTPADVLSSFRQSATPLARRLATLMATVPISLPIVHLVRSVMLPEATRAEEAEFLLSGMVRHRPGYPDGYFEFMPGVRETLARSVSRSEALFLLARVGDFIGERVKQVSDFGAVLAAPNAAKRLETLATGSAGEMQVFALVASEALMRLGGFATKPDGVSVTTSQGSRPNRRKVVASLAGKALLWIDDQLEAHAEEVLQVASAGAFLTIAGSPQDAAHALDEHSFDGVICRLRMADDEASFIRKLDSFSADNSDLPVALMVGSYSAGLDGSTSPDALIRARDFASLCRRLGEAIDERERPPLLSQRQAARVVAALSENPAAFGWSRALVERPTETEWRAVWDACAGHRAAVRLAAFVLEAATKANCCELWEVTGQRAAVSDLIIGSQSESDHGQLRAAVIRAVQSGTFLVQQLGGPETPPYPDQSLLVFPLAHGKGHEAARAVSVLVRGASAFSGNQLEWLSSLAAAVEDLLDGYGLPGSIEEATTLHDGLVGLDPFGQLAVLIRANYRTLRCLRLPEEGDADDARTFDLAHASLAFAERAARRGDRGGAIKLPSDDPSSVSAGIRDVLTAARQVASLAAGTGADLRSTVGATIRAMRTLEGGGSASSGSSLVTMIENDFENLRQLRRSDRGTDAFQPCPIDAAGPLWLKRRTAGGAIVRRWALVVGLGASSLPPDVEATCRELGIELAVANIGLITGGWPGVDLAVTRAYLNRLEFAGLGSEKRLKQVVEPGRMPSVEAGMILRADGLEATLYHPRARADVVILVSGSGWTLHVGTRAWRDGLTVLPLGASGGDAAELYGRMNESWPSSPLRHLSREQFVRLGQPGLGAVDAAIGAIEALPATASQGFALGEVMALAERYDRLREATSSGPTRTREMTAIYMQMRSKAGAIGEALPRLLDAPSAGERLAAVSVLYESPRPEFLDWLVSRLDPDVEKPFVAYQAAIALKQAVVTLPTSQCRRLHDAIETATSLASRRRSGSDALQALKSAAAKLDSKCSVSLIGTSTPVSRLEGHAGAILRTTWRQDGRQLATGSVDRTARVWDVNDASTVAVLAGHEHGVNQACWSPDGMRLATCSFDRTIRIWTTDEWSCISVMHCEGGDVTDVAWSPDGNYLASACEDCTVSLWRTADWQREAQHAHHGAAVRRLLWLDRGAKLASGSLDGNVVIVDVPFLPTPASVLCTRYAGVVAMELHTPTGLLATSNRDNRIRLWDWREGKVAREISTRRLIRSLSFSADGEYLAGSEYGPNGNVQVWVCTTWKVIASIPEPTSEFWPSSIGWSPAEPMLATLDQRDQAVRLWLISQQGARGEALA